jgi:hypothetical protein
MFLDTIIFSLVMLLKLLILNTTELVENVDTYRVFNLSLKKEF